MKRGVEDFSVIGAYPLGYEDGIFQSEFPSPIFSAPFNDPDNPLRAITGGPLTMVRATKGWYLNPVTGLITEAANNILRIEANGALIEGQRTNLCLQSQILGTTWAPTNITVADNNEVSPDGATNAELLTATAGNGTLIQDLGVVASAAKTFSIYLKRKTGTGDIDLTVNGGGAWTTVVITSEWVRYDLTATVADPDVGIRIVTDTDAVWAWGGQLEDSAAFPSSYIPTVAAAVTRNADVLTLGVSNINLAVGTIVCTFDTALVGGRGTLLASVGVPDSPIFYFENNFLKFYDGTTVIIGPAESQTAPATVAVKWVSAGVPPVFAIGGSASDGDDNFDGSLVDDDIVIGGRELTDDHKLYGHIEGLEIYSVELSGAQMIAKTS